MSTISWGDVGRRNSQSGGDRINFLKFEAGKEYIIRPIGDPKKVAKYYIPGPGNSKGKGAISDAGKNCVILTKYRNAEDEPLYAQRNRYAFNCINRADGKLALVETSATVASAIRDWGEENNVHPGGPNGCDFKIKVLKTGPLPMDIEYKVFNKSQTPFTAEEQEMTKQVYDLDKIFHATPQSDIEAKLGLVEASTEAEAPSTAAAKTAPAKATAAAGAAEDLDF